MAHHYRRPHPIAVHLTAYFQISVENRTYIADYNGSDIRHIISHLACFFAGNWTMGGRLFDDQEVVDIELELN